VGDHVPDILISKIIRNSKNFARLSDFREKLLILDFWDTFCGSCIEALPKLDLLQKQFGDKIKIMPVSYQSQYVLETFFKTNRLAKGLQLPCVVEDRILGSYFPYLFISHEVWIYKGKVVAITGSDYVTSENINTILKDKEVDWPVKNDLTDFDPFKPIFTQNQTDQYNTKSKFLRYSGITGQRDGINYRGDNLKQKYDSVGHFYRTAFYNYSIVDAFNMITFNIKPRNFLINSHRLILEVKDKSKYIYDRKYGIRSDWEREHQFCYELVSAIPIEDKKRFQYIHNDLSHILDVHARIETRRVKCLVMVKTKDINNLDSLNKARFTEVKGQKIAMSAIPVFFLDQTGLYPPALDETGFKGSVVINNFQNIKDLGMQLQVYGCDIIEAERDIEVMVITENGYMKQ